MVHKRTATTTKSYSLPRNKLVCPHLVTVSLTLSILEEQVNPVLTQKYASLISVTWNIVHCIRNHQKKSYILFITV